MAGPHGRRRFDVAVGRDHRARALDRVLCRSALPLDEAVLMYRLLPQSFFEWCAATPLGKFIAASVWTMPILETFHIMGLVLLLGAAFTLNLTVLGVGVRVPSERRAGQLPPVGAAA